MKIESLCAGYHKKIIVKDVNLEVKKGEIISLIGPNGGGKSTLLKSISGELKTISGTVYLGKEDIRKIPLKELSKKMSIVNTDRVKPEHMTAFDVVLAGRLPYSDGFGMFSESDREAAKKACELMKIAKFEEKSFSDLSDGQKQRTLIARAICQDPEFLIMDEPTSYLDIKHRFELLDVIKGLSEQGVTVIMSLHELELALQISHRLLLIRDDGSVSCSDPGEVLQKGMIKDLYGMSDEMYERVKKQLGVGADATDNRSESRGAEKSGKGIVSTGRDADSPRHSSYFLNKECEYYPCHDLAEEKFSCMFCYCPLYDMEDCGGTYTYTEKGAKNCKDCTFPHDRDNYPAVIKKLKEKMYGKN